MGLFGPNIKKMARNNDVESLIKLLEGRDNANLKHHQSLEVIHALGLCGDPRATVPLLNILRNKMKNDISVHQRVAALIALGEIKDLKAIEQIIELIEKVQENEQGMELREVALQALVRFKDPRVVEVIKKLILDQKDILWDSALTHAIQLESEEILEILWQSLETGDPSPQMVTKLALTLPGEPRLIKHLIKIQAWSTSGVLVDIAQEYYVEDELIQEATATLEGFDDAAMDEGYLTALMDPDHRVRAFAAEMLGLRQVNSARETLEELIHSDPESMVQEMARQALLHLEESIPD